MKITSLILLLLTVHLTKAVYEKNYDEAYTIAASMSIDQKIGQTIQVDFYGITSKTGTSASDAIKYSLGSILIGGNGAPDANGNCINFDGLKEDQVKEIYASATADKWKALGDKFTYTVNVQANNGKSYKIKSLLATDAVHGDQHVAGSILFPHNIGLSCSRNSNHFYNAGYWTTKSLKSYGFNYAFTPTVAVSHNPQWGRYYETMGQDPKYIYEYAKAFTEGVQGKPGEFTGILGSVKHFFADGATMYGADQGNSLVGSFKTFVDHNVQGYNGSISVGIGSVMASYSAINYVPLAGGPYLKSILRGDLKFDGFVISDYSQVQKMSSQYLPTMLSIMQRNESVAQLFAAGIDMFMIPSRESMLEYIQFVKQGLQNNTITMDRLNDAVARILSVKMAMGMVDSNNAKKDQAEVAKETVPHATSEYQDSLDAVHESLVLLKNEQTIPVQKSLLEYIVLVGEKVININNLAKHELFLSYDNIGMQNGGWTGRWQGFEGNPLWQGENKKTSNASSILDGLKNLNRKFNLVHPNYTTYTDTLKIAVERTKYLEDLKVLRKNMNAKNTLILSVVGESPYSEMAGDINVPYCQNQSVYGGQGCIWWPNAYSPPIQPNTLEIKFNEFEKNVITHIKDQDKNIPLVTVLLSGRPMIVNDILNESSAFLSAFLPGTSGGQGIVDAIFGDYVMRPNGASSEVNTLSFDWPSNMESLKEFPYYAADGKVPEISDSLFKIGYGLSSAK